MSIKTVFVINEAGRFTVIPGGKSEYEPSDPQGILNLAGETQQGKLLTAIDYVLASLKTFRADIKEGKQDFNSIVLDMTETVNGFNQAVHLALDNED
jgi:hypothetical protein